MIFHLPSHQLAKVIRPFHASCYSNYLAVKYYRFTFSLDDLLRAGIAWAENVVVVNQEISNSAEEDTLSDCNTIVSVQTVFK